jgi:ribose-phosphate pyrophosphokinase
MIVLGGSSSLELAKEVSSVLGCELGMAEIKRFPDGEQFVRIDSSVEGDDVAVVLSTSRPQDENLMELYFIMDALVDLKANVTAIIPYYGYGRQDRAFNKGEAVSSKTIAKHIQLSAKKVITVNPHKEYILDYFDIPAFSVDASPLIGEYFIDKDLDQPVVVAPDAGSQGLAQKVAGVTGWTYGCCEKRRLGPGRVVTSAEKIELNGEDVIIPHRECRQKDP